MKQAIQSDDVQELIKNAKKNICDIKQNNHLNAINEAAEALSNIYIFSAKQALKVKPKHYKAKKRKHRNKRWFDLNCITLRKECRSLLNALNRNPFSKYLREKYFSIQKKYKQTIRKKKLDHKRKLSNMLEQHIENNPQIVLNTLKELKRETLDNTGDKQKLPNKKWYDHLLKLLGTNPTIDDSRLDEIKKELNLEKNRVNQNTMDTINNLITEKESITATKNLKNKKSPGHDSVTNEMIKSTISEMSPLLLKTFNYVLDTGIFPDSWKTGCNVPIYKSGCPTNPNNYRGITLTSTLGKLFCQILNTRICNYLEENDLYTNKQAGFRKNMRTSDQIFVINSLINEITKDKNSRLYCCFVDFSKAFDNVCHEAMLLKLAKIGIKGKCFDIIENMYSNACINVGYYDESMPSIKIKKGVHQGNNLSPTLFNVFVNDIPEKLKDNDSPFLEHEQISCLLYADDLAILSTTKLGLQNKLNILEKYCDAWGLEINNNKTKIIVFAKQNPKTPFHFHFGTTLISVVDSYKYLGIVLHKNGTFTETENHLHNQSRKATFALKNILFGTELNPEIILKLYDALITPITTYAAETWFPYSFNSKYENTNALFDKYFSKNFLCEKIHVDFCRYILGMNKKSMVGPVLAELGRYPMIIKIIKNTLSYWLHILSSKETSIVYKTYIHIKKNNNNQWVNFIKNILRLLELNHVWENQHTFSVNRLKYVIQVKLEQEYRHFWDQTKNTKHRLEFYNKFASTKYQMEPYIIKKPKQD